jgi:hypothetical protein
MLLLVGVVAAVWLLARRPFVVDTSATSDGIRAESWTFVPEDFSLLEGAYLSLVRQAPFIFTAAGVHIAVGTAAAFPPDIELRLRAEGDEWSPWYTIGEFEAEADGRLYGENLVTWSAAREAQVRIFSSSPLQRTLQDLTVIAIDASDGPTATQATASARNRAAAADQGDSGVPKPVVISRAEWGANESWMTWNPYYAPVEKAMVHHTVSGGGADPAAEVRSIYYYHAVSRGWGDIGYNYVVDPYGNIYEGRYGGDDVIGAHVGYWNSRSLGMSVLGCYDNESCGAPRMPTNESLSAIADLVAWTSSRRLIDPRQLRQFSNGSSTVTNYVLSGHRDYGSTVCPGDNIYAELPNLRGVAWERVPEYDIRYGWHDTPTTMDAGEQLAVHPTLTNYGRLVWSNGAGVRLGYRWIKDGQVVAENSDAGRIIPDAVVGIGEMTSLVAQLTAPNISGNLTLRWDLYRDGVGWFADQPAPAGRSQPLDVTVEVVPGLNLGVRLTPPFVSGGATLRMDITERGPAGKAFETRTPLPSSVEYVGGSGSSGVGEIRLESGAVVWTGTLVGGDVGASFDLLVSSGINTPSALSIKTTFSVAEFSPLDVTNLLIVNGYHHTLPFVARAWIGDQEDDYEENDSWLQAYGPLSSGQTNQAYPNDTEDYYYFQLSAPATVSVNVENFVPTSSNGTVALYGPVTGNELGEQIAYYGTPGHSSMSLGPHPLGPGKYYVRVYTANGFSTTQPYALRITY